MAEKEYNIIFYMLASNDPMTGGIERVSSILAGEFVLRGCKVYSLSNVCSGRFNYTDSFVLPEPWRVSTRNSDYIKELVSILNVDFIIAANMPYPMMMDNLLNLGGSVKIISHYHSSPRLAYSRFYVLDRYSISNKRWFQKCVFAVQHRLKAHLFVRMFEISDKVVMLSEAYLSEFRMFTDVEKSKVTAITNPVTFKATDCALDGKEKIVLWVGRINESEKRISSLLRIWKMASRKMPGWRLQILGGGNEFDKWKFKAESMGLRNYEFLGFCTPDEYYRKASIYVMTSNIEGWGMTLVEAMSCSCAPILFDSYACASDIVDGGKCGILVKPFEDKTFADKLVELALDGGKRRGIADAAFKKAMSYNTDEIIDKWYQLFESLNLQNSGGENE